MKQLITMPLCMLLLGCAVPATWEEGREASADRQSRIVGNMTRWYAFQSPLTKTAVKSAIDAQLPAGCGLTLACPGQLPTIGLDLNERTSGESALRIEQLGEAVTVYRQQPLAYKILFRQLLDGQTAPCTLRLCCDDDEPALQCSLPTQAPPVLDEGPLKDKLEES